MIAPLIKEWPPIGEGPDQEAADDLALLAQSWAYSLANQCRHVPRASLQELAECVADAISGAFFDIGGELDRDVFLELAGFGPEAGLVMA